MAAPAKKPCPPRPPLKLRLKGWWEGFDVVVHGRPPEDKKPEPAPAAPPRRVIGVSDPDRPWQTARTKINAMLWGEGFSQPGDAAHVLELVKPFALDPAMTLVDLCAGLGGGARAIAETFGVWVTGMEPDPELAAAGMQISTSTGFGRKASIVQYDPATLDIRAGTVDCVLCRQLLHRVENKLWFLGALERGMKPRGQAVITDYVLAEAGRTRSRPVEAWIGCESQPLHLWPNEAYVQAFEDQGFEVRVSEDMTAEFRRMVLNGWAGLAAAAENCSLEPELVQALVVELELWTRRVAAMESGDIRLMRYYMRKAPGIRPMSGP